MIVDPKVWITATIPGRIFSPAVVIIISSTVSHAARQSPPNNSRCRMKYGRSIYKLQVSPGPGTATFTDVPTGHLFFQYIEALAAAGITGGCNASPPQYCPDAPVTRGQMAVFVSRALSLHWVP